MRTWGRGGVSLLRPIPFVRPNGNAGMNHEDGFLQALLEAPDDDTVRFVYADWLEEQGDPRAEFIRAQCAAARMVADDHRLQALRARERQLLAEHAREWCAPLGLEPDQCEFRRGFVEAVEIHADRFLECPEGLFQVAPIHKIHFLHATKRIRDLAACPWLGKLRTLDLSANALRDPGAATLAASPHLSKLTGLDLGGCEVHQEGAERLASADGLQGLQVLRLAGCEIGPSGLRAILQSPGLGRVTALDVRGNHQCWVTPNQGEPWITLTEPNIKNDGVRLLAEGRDAARLESINLSLNLIEASGWDAILNSPHLAGVLSLNVFESNHVYVEEGPADPSTVELPRSINEEISDVLCMSIPGGNRRLIGKSPGDPRWTPPPCTLEEDVVERLQNRFGQRLTFTPPSVRFGAHFSGVRDDWYGYRAILDSRA
jgi:uncharacterized protein (TIGR02996 family)